MLKVKYGSDSFLHGSRTLWDNFLSQKGYFVHCKDAFACVNYKAVLFQVLKNLLQILQILFDIVRSYQNIINEWKSAQSSQNLVDLA